MSYFENIPSELRKQPLWVRYDLVSRKPGKKPDKVPNLKWRTPELREANLKQLDYLIKKRPPRPGGGYALWIDPKAGYTYIDLDHVRDPQTEVVADWAQKIVDQLDSYTEVSASGTGLHIVVRAKLGADFSIAGNPVEIYSGHISKLMAVTGNVLLYCEKIEDRQDAAAELLKQAQEGKFGPTDGSKPESNDEPELGESLKIASPEEYKIKDMPEAVLDGWLGEVYREHMSDFPIALAWPALLAAASVHVPHSDMRTNLFVNTDGIIGTGKSSAYERAFKLLSVNEPELLKLKAGSAEGLVQYVGDVNGAARLLYPDEMAHLLEKGAIEGASLPRFLTTAFYDDSQNLTVKGRKFLKFNARLTIAGGTVTDEFGDLFGSATTKGLYDRFLFGTCPTGYLHKWRNPKEFEPVWRPKSSSDSEFDESSFMTAKRPVAVSIDGSVWMERNRWIDELKFNVRIVEICLRAAVICAAFDCRDVLNADMLGPALELARYQARVRALLQPNPGVNYNAQVANLIRNWLSKRVQDDSWTRFRGLDTATHISKKYGPNVVEQTIRAMAASGELEVLTGPKKSRLIRLAPDPEVPGTADRTADRSSAVDELETIETEVRTVSL